MPVCAVLLSTIVVMTVVPKEVTVKPAAVNPRDSQTAAVRRITQHLTRAVGFRFRVAREIYMWLSSLVISIKLSYLSNNELLLIRKNSVCWSIALCHPAATLIQLVLSMDANVTFRAAG